MLTAGHLDYDNGSRDKKFGLRHGAVRLSRGWVIVGGDSFLSRPSGSDTPKVRPTRTWIPPPITAYTLQALSAGVSRRLEVELLVLDVLFNPNVPL